MTSKYHEHSHLWDHVYPVKHVTVHLLHRDKPLCVWTAASYDLQSQMEQADVPALSFFAFFMGWDVPGIERQVQITIPKTSIVYLSEESVDERGQIRALFQHANDGGQMIIVDPDQ